MFKKIILLSIYAFFLISCSAQKDFIKISDDIYRDRVKRTSKYLKQENYVNKLRKQFYNEGKLSFIKNGLIFYMIEGYDLESNITYVTIFNKKGELNFEFDSKTFKISQPSLYEENLKEMIVNWNIDKIKQQEKDNELLGGLDIIATKITCNTDGSVDEIKNIFFSEF